MQKINFNNKYYLESAVLSGVKTMTRRVISDVNAIQILQELEDDGWRHYADIQIFIDKYPRYKKEEVVAIAQRYSDVWNDPFTVEACLSDELNPEFLRYEKGWNNKMFVKAAYMPHRIRITDIKIERLQDISDEDCLKEGIVVDAHREVLSDDIYMFEVNGKHYCQWHFYTPREAFAALINKVSPGLWCFDNERGQKMWDTNPFVFAYTFELVK